MNKWEYYTLRSDSNLTITLEKKYHITIELIKSKVPYIKENRDNIVFQIDNVLNHFGNEGWELISTTPVSYSTSKTYVDYTFKRPKD